MTKRAKVKRVVMTVPEAGALLGLGRNAAYTAAQRGDIPTIRIGKLVKVPIAALDRMLSGVDDKRPRKVA